MIFFLNTTSERKNFQCMNNVRNQCTDTFMANVSEFMSDTVCNVISILDAQIKISETLHFTNN